MADQPTHTHDCPRCGYDLSGAIESWSISCPLRGVCAECGLNFLWVQVLDPARRIPSWFFEHADRARLRAFLSTSFRTLLPARFWRSVRMEMPTSFLRLLALAALWLPFLMLFHAVATELWLRGLQVFGSAGWGYSFTWDDRIRESVWPRTLLGDGDLTSLFLMVDTSQLPFVTWWLLFASCLTPFCFLLLPQTFRRAKVRRRHLLRIWLYAVPSLFMLISIPWIGDDLFDAARGLIWRAGLNLGFDVYHWGGQWAMYRWRILAVLWTLWQILWWSSACRFYLRLPNARSVAIMLVVLALLITALPFVVIPSLSYNWITDLFKV